MRAVQIQTFKGPEGLALVDVPRPRPRPDQVLVRVVRCGVNPVDRSQAVGRWQWLELPHVPGSEISGIVEEVGEVAGPFRPGQRVAMALRVFCGRCHYCLQGHEEACNADPRSATAPMLVGLPSEGGYAEYVVVPATNVIPLPDGLDFDTACVATLDGVTAWHEIDRANVQPGEHVLVTGATGGLGTFFIQLAKQRGAVVYALTGHTAAADLLRELGADAVINRRDADCTAQVRTLTGGRGVDVVLDALGAGMLAANLGVLAPLGRLVFCGILTGAQAQFDMAPFYAQQQQIIGSTGGTRRDLATLLDALARGSVRATIWRHYPLAAAATAMQALGDENRIGKIILDVASGNA